MANKVWPKSGATAPQLCQCGCGKITPIAPESRPARGWVKGERMPYYPHHRKNRWPIADGISKQCRVCREIKPLQQFSRDATKRDKLQHFCRSCSKANSYSYKLSSGGKVRVSLLRQKHRLKAYHMTPQEYEERLLDQDGRCAICRQPETMMRLGTPRALCVDHCHKTGRIRGLLCAHCNHAIGKLGEDPALIRRAADYVERGGL